ncbi:MAG: hypothetical protein ABG776_02570 [Cyanobacteria bacterium J06555_13]
MASKLRLGLTSFVSAACILAFTPISVSANPFNNILNTINGVNNTVNSIDNTINGTRYTINSLSETLGINSDAAGGGDDPTGQVLQLYQAWYTDLEPTEQETVSWLVLENAKGQVVTFDTVSSSDWFLQKPVEEQSQVASTFFKLQSLLDASAQDRNRFLGFAFCVNSGNEDCAM